MNTLIRWFQEIDGQEIALSGGKGANLGRLTQIGLPVPPGFVITVGAHQAFLAANNLTNTDPEVLRDRITDSPIPAEVGAAILDAYQKLGASAVAVRSSATAEDLAAASFAGQHDTSLNVTGTEALLTAVRTCWASLWSPRAVEYRQQQGWGDQDVAMAVVVQTMVQAEWAGVMFTANPVTGQQGEIVIESVAGLGDALVSGEARGERHVVEKATRRILAGESLIPHRIIEELSGLGLQIEKAFGQPQDIEWAYAGGRCYILQSRPITALPTEVPEAAPKGRKRYNYFQRANAPNMVDHIPLPPHPFDYSLFYRPGMERVFQALRALGFSPPALGDVFVEIADGVVQVVPPAFRPTLRALSLPAKLVTALRARPYEWLKECRDTLAALAHEIDREDLSALSDAELLDRIETLRQHQVRLFVPRFGFFPRGMLITRGLAFLLRLAVGKGALKLETDLLASIPCKTTEVNRELGRLARLIRESEEIRRVVLKESPERIPDRLSDSAPGRAYLAEMEAFFRRFGYRETAMPAAGLPAWRDQPGIVYGLLKGLVAGDGGPSALDSDDAERAERARQDVVAALSAGWFGLGRRLLLPLFLKALQTTRNFIAFREDSHFYLFMPFPVIRRLALELGRRWVERGVLDDPGEIFFAEIEEIKGPGPAAEIREKVQKRKRARRSVEGRYTTVPAELLERANPAGEVRGAPVSPGQAVGQVRVILNEKDFWKLQKGDVLVARYTNPAWTPLFALAAAVVVDAGGVASHAAIVAREYGVPAVMGAGNATRVLREGQRVMVDGSTGTVSLIRTNGGQK